MKTKTKNPNTKSSIFRNPITDCSKLVLVRGKQAGFVPLLITILIVLVVVIYLVFVRVLHSSK